MGGGGSGEDVPFRSAVSEGVARFLHGIRRNQTISDLGGRLASESG